MAGYAACHPFAVSGPLGRCSAWLSKNHPSPAKLKVEHFANGRRCERASAPWLPKSENSRSLSPLREWIDEKPKRSRSGRRTSHYDSNGLGPRGWHLRHPQCHRVRPEWHLAKLKAQVTYGDVVMVTRLDRLARSTRDFLNTLAELTERGVGFRSIKDAGIDTTSATGQLVLQILASIGEFERKLIRSRVEDGTKRAIARGVKFGRKPKLNRHQREEARARLQAGET
jgi:hypothetical protein